MKLNGPRVHDQRSHLGLESPEAAGARVEVREIPGVSLLLPKAHVTLEHRLEDFYGLAHASTWRLPERRQPHAQNFRREFGCCHVGVEEPAPLLVPDLHDIRLTSTAMVAMTALDSAVRRVTG